MFRAGLEAFVICVLLTPILRDVFRSYNIVDQPGHRKVHVHPIPRVGGIPIAIAYGTALLTLNNAGEGLDIALWKLAPGAALVFLTGVLDDLFNLRPSVKLAGLIGAALLVYASGLRIDAFGETQLPMWLNLPVTVFWLLLTTNALNLIDGLDGLCAGVGLLATLTLMGAAMLRGNYSLVMATAPLACALAGFLCYNLNRATVFLGDSGALLIGFLLGCYGMIWTQKTSTVISILVPLIALSLPLLDLGLSVIRRALGRKPIFGADRGHIHHRLLDRGLTPGKAVLVLYLTGGAAAGLGLLLSVPEVAKFQNIVLAVLLVGVWWGLRKLRYRELDLMGRMIFGGGLQQHVQRKMNSEQMEALLASALGADAWWDALTTSVAELKLSRMRWSGPEGRHEKIWNEPPGDWRFRMELGDWGTLEIEGGAHTPPDLSEISEVVRRTVGRNWATQRESAVRLEGHA